MSYTQKLSNNYGWMTAGLAITASAAVFLAAGCGSSDASDGSASEITASAMSGAVNSSEGTMAILEGAKEQKSILATVLDATQPFANAYAAATCATTRAASSCSGQVITTALSGCTVGSAATGATWTGNEVITFTSGCSGSAATLNTTAASLVFTRGTDAAGIVRTANANSRTVTYTTLDNSGFSAAKTGGTQVTCGSSGCGTSRTVSIKGVHLVGGGGLTWDHTVSTDTDIAVTGTGAARVIGSGVIRVQHNLAKFTSVATINGPLNHVAGCCFPVSGSITSAISGGKFDGKTESIAFSSTCGQATLTDSKGTQSPLALTHCL